MKKEEIIVFLPPSKKKLGFYSLPPSSLKDVSLLLNTAAKSTGQNVPLQDVIQYTLDHLYTAVTLVLKLVDDSSAGDRELRISTGLRN